MMGRYAIMVSFSAEQWRKLSELARRRQTTVEVVLQRMADTIAAEGDQWRHPQEGLTAPLQEEPVHNRRKNDP